MASDALVVVVPKERLVLTFGDEDYADCRVVCNDIEWQCHRIVICRQSGFFKELIKSANIVNECRVIDLSALGSPAAIQRALDFMYTGDYQVLLYDGQPIEAVADISESLSAFRISDNISMIHLTSKTLSVAPSSIPSPKSCAVIHMQTYAIATILGLDDLRSLALESVYGELGDPLPLARLRLIAKESPFARCRYPGTIHRAQSAREGTVKVAQAKEVIGIIAGYEKKLNNVRDKFSVQRSQLLGENDALRKELNSARSAHAKDKDILQEAQKKIAKQETELASLRDQLSVRRSQLQGANVSLRKELAGTRSIFSVAKETLRQEHVAAQEVYFEEIKDLRKQIEAARLNGQKEKNLASQNGRNRFLENLRSKFHSVLLNEDECCRHCNAYLDSAYFHEYSDGRISWKCRDCGTKHGDVECY
ncbi:hypothetical protein K402DRAFT_403688 [Aulographum hederae CBS 113979]|uniref:BTB domain-containing protein n=1 Tax=Aulographum hederae CBS 113979 TaxID=1176131 RepID=A0A6G1H1V5_9PEZI|nr:hypothetical protein K402DRAFT_403688 [Aulographum hederae CBS 113979]